MSTTTSPKLKSSDYLQGAAIVTGIIGSSNFIQSSLQSGGPTPGGIEISGVALLLTTIFTSLSQWLQGKGD
jgi:hypothetical protein